MEPKRTSYEEAMSVLLNSVHNLALIPLDRGKCVPSFDEMMDIDLVEVDFDVPNIEIASATI